MTKYKKRSFVIDDKLPFQLTALIVIYVIAFALGIISIYDALTCVDCGRMALFLKRWELFTAGTALCIVLGAYLHFSVKKS